MAACPVHSDRRYFLPHHVRRVCRGRSGNTDTLSGPSKKCGAGKYRETCMGRSRDRRIHPALADFYLSSLLQDFPILSVGRQLRRPIHAGLPETLLRLLVSDQQLYFPADFVSAVMDPPA